jgi:AcrR family transcriptional regulator
MARPKSEDKRNAILVAATAVFAERGLGAATAAISSTAEVAEGTLFTYFRTKDELVNALYREIKVELAEVMMSGFPRRGSVRKRLQHIWDCFVEWGVANPLKRRVLRLLETSDKLMLESKQAGAAPFVAIQAMVEEAVAQRVIQDLPQMFIAATMQALADTTMDFMMLHPRKKEQYRVMGFEMLWAGIAAKKG